MWNDWVTWRLNHKHGMMIPYVAFNGLPCRIHRRIWIEITVIVDWAEWIGSNEMWVFPWGAVHLERALRPAHIHHVIVLHSGSGNSGWLNRVLWSNGQRNYVLCLFLNTFPWPWWKKKSWDQGKIGGRIWFWKVNFWGWRQHISPSWCAAVTML